MLRNLWGVSIKVPNLEQELEFHRRIGNRIGDSFTLWIGFTTQEKIDSGPFYVSRFMLHAL